MPEKTQILGRIWLPPAIESTNELSQSIAASGIKSVFPDSGRSRQEPRAWPVAPHLVGDEVWFQTLEFLLGLEADCQIIAHHEQSP